MNAFYIVFISFASAVDGLFLGLPFGLRGTRLQTRHLLALSVLNLPVVAVAILFAGAVGYWFSAAEKLGGYILVVSGLISLLTSFREKSSAVSAHMRDLWPVGLALAMDSAASSFSLALWVENPYYLPILFTVSHFLLVFAGNRIGLKGETKVNNRIARLLPSCVIMLLGLTRLL